jgi:hypothetical protein
MVLKQLIHLVPDETTLKEKTANISTSNESHDTSSKHASMQRSLA